MPIIIANGIRQHFRLEGPDHAPVVMLSNSLGTDLSMWDAVAGALVGHLRVLRYDTRGHGASEAPPGPYDVAQLGHDVLALLDALCISQVHFCGLSMGGLIGQWLALHAPDRIDRLILANTAAKIGAASIWQERIETVSQQGMVAVAKSTPSRWFTESFAARAPAVVAGMVHQLELADPKGYAANCAAVAAADFRQSLGDIRAKTLCIAGDADPVTTPADADALAAGIPHADRVDLPAAHLSAVEAAEGFSTALMTFLLKHDGHRDEDTRYAQGLEVRRAVLGNAHVDRSLRALSEHNEEFQDLITRYVWGEIWTRSGLPRHSRSILTIAMLVALNREEELRLHLNAARNNGVSRETIREVLLQTAIYCGVPAANSAFHLAERVFSDQDAETQATTRTDR